jgi:hypothetical protein
VKKVIVAALMTVLGLAVGIAGARLLIGPERTVVPPIEIEEPDGNDGKKKPKPLKDDRKRDNRPSRGNDRGPAPAPAPAPVPVDDTSGAEPAPPPPPQPAGDDDDDDGDDDGGDDDGDDGDDD